MALPFPGPIRGRSRSLPDGVRIDGVDGSRRIHDASPTSAIHRQRRCGENWAPHRAASPMHRRCGS
eukprot:3972896-Pyramimonas_sp.AAC.1